jgi:hypothetical protein
MTAPNDSTPPVDPRPTRQDAANGVWPVKRGFPAKWGHNDPAEVCPTKNGDHRSMETAIRCEDNSLQIAWKRRKSP